MSSVTDTDRRTAFLILKEIDVQGAYSNLALNKHLKSGDVYSAAFVRELVYGVLKNQLLLDYNINQLLQKPGSKLKPGERILLRMGLYQLLFMDSVTDYAALNETVNLAGLFAKGQKGFINAVLRSFVRKGKVIALPDGMEELELLSVKYSCHQWIVKLWLDAFGAEKTERLLSAGNEVPPFTLRVNLCKWSREDCIKKLQEVGYVAKEGTHSSTSIHIKGNDILSDNLYRGGYFSVQDESSQLAIGLLDPKPGDVLIDLCAAPGGKSCAAAEKMNNCGCIYSFDLYPQKKVLIEKEIKRLGLSSIVAKTADATVFDLEMKEKADCVLVDAPCSGLGVIRRKPEIKLKPQQDQLEAIACKQLRLLSTACGYVKPGGKLMYSTCTINPEENENVTDQFLKTHPEFSEEKRKQLLPFEDGTDGFYICLMRRQND
ncbi:MAG: 16S rRNA (cytosine(967)-C(5))-methyltransferase RsmB [Clostridia bacterium]|nr:16S rRNA (cytosine(967)-C(5))-methyltransferase RsmB [Clostridia bacterium]